MRKSTILAGIAGVAVAGISMSASAERISNDPAAPNIYTKYGASITAGGGILGFTDGDTRDVVSTIGGAWDVRVAFGTREQVAVEAAYLGSAYGLDALGLEDDAKLLGTGLEVLGRINFLKDQWQPYALAGFGWRHYSIISSDRNTSNVTDGEDLGEVPLGAGVAYRYRGLVVDARAVLRLAFNDELIATEPGQDDASLDNWQAQLTAGWEF